MPKDDLAHSLQEFGLSRYEASAYLALLSKGPLSVSELAYHANIPRTKAYGTLNKLAKKGIAKITHDKPVIYNATSPREVLGGLVAGQERRVRGMRSTMESLHKIALEGRRPKGAEEQVCLVLDPDSVLRVVQQLISTARSSMVSALDGWGARLLSQCSYSLKQALAKNVHVKLLVCRGCTTDFLSSLPKYVDAKVGGESMNMFIFDGTTIILVNGSDGRGVLFRSTDVLASICNNLFYGMWSSGIDIALEGSTHMQTPDTETKLVNVMTEESGDKHKHHQQHKF